MNECNRLCCERKVVAYYLDKGNGCIYCYCELHLKTFRETTESWFNVVPITREQSIKVRNKMKALL